MNEEINPLSASAICMGCLSCDRNLRSLSDEESKLFIDEYLESFDNTKEPILLCWECVALLQKTVKFKRQVKFAKDSLISCLYNNSPLKPLSGLQISKTHILDTTNVTGIRKSTQKRTLNSQVNPIDSNTVNNLPDETNLKTDSTIQYSILEPTVQNGDWETVKLDSDYNETKYELFVQKYDCTFTDTVVKTEDCDSNMDDGYFIDDDYDDEQDMDKYKEIAKVDVECETAEPESMKRKSEVTYEDSDDEPLMKKKEEKKSRKRKKKDPSAPKVDRRHNPGPKREKPAGVVQNPRVARKLQQLNVASDQLEMVLLSWQEVEEERQKSLASETFTRHQYRCYDCVLGFNYRVKLDNHMKKHDPSSGDLVCEVCKIHCKNSHALSAHRRRHRVRWRCRLCGGRWSRAGVAADHLARDHGDKPPTHTCTLCRHTETSLGKLRNHMKNHSERQKCELCGKTFRNRDSLRTHLFIHKGEKEYECPTCGKRFLFKRALHVHLITHDAPALLYCHECDMNFKNRMSYGQHMRYSLKHIDPAKLKHACPLCDKRFVKAARLQEHHLAVHLKATPFRCAVPGCDFASSSRPVLRSHVRMSHRDGRSRRNYVCHACGKAYKNKKTLEGHLRSHSGERPFRCGSCGASFGYEAALYNHHKLVHRAGKVPKRAPPEPTAVQWSPT